MNKYNHPEEYERGVYKIWHTMIRRCTNKKTNGYARYGGRGITVCNEWLGVNGFVVFYKEMGNRPTTKHSIDRLDNDKGYCKANCKWATKKEQSNSRTDNHNIEIDGITKTLMQWAELVGVNVQTIAERLKRGWTAKKAVFLPVKSTGYKHQIKRRKSNDI